MLQLDPLLEKYPIVFTMSSIQQTPSRASEEKQKSTSSNGDITLAERSTNHEGITEVFKEGEDVNFRTVGWIWASIIFLKSRFSCE